MPPFRCEPTRAGLHLFQSSPEWFTAQKLLTKVMQEMDMRLVPLLWTFEPARARRLIRDASPPFHLRSPHRQWRTADMSLCAHHCDRDS